MSIVSYQDRSIMTFTSFDESMKWATLISKTKMCPKRYEGDPCSILVAIQFGRELGLPPMQSLQNIAVINGIPSVYGDSQLAICQNAPDFEDIIETFCEKTMTATCTIKRKGKADLTRNFSKDDAVKAGLWGKAGPWTTYPKRMLQMRARGFALRDAYSNLLKGLISVEEAEDYPEEKVINEYVVRDKNPLTKELDVKKHREYLIETYEHDENLEKELSILKEIEQKEQKNKKITNLHEELIKLIAQKGAPIKWQNDQLKNAGVSDLYSLDDGTVFNMIQYLKAKEDKKILDEEDAQVINMIGGKQ